MIANPFPNSYQERDYHKFYDTIIENQLSRQFLYEDFLLNKILYTYLHFFVEIMFQGTAEWAKNNLLLNFPQIIVSLYTVCWHEKLNPLSSKTYKKFSIFSFPKINENKNCTQSLFNKIKKINPNFRRFGEFWNSSINEYIGNKEFLWTNQNFPFEKYTCAMNKIGST